MRCHICDSILGESEVKYNRLEKEFDPCSNCLSVISEVYDDYIPEEEFIEQNQDDILIDDFSLDNIS